MRQPRIQLSAVLLASLAWSSLAFGEDDSTPSEVLLISTLHGAHKDHPTFDYEVLYRVVELFEPDFVGVEVRPEDMGRPTEYLLRNYPTEMIELARRYGSERSFGFDWLGEEIAGAAIPDGYWKTSRIKQLSAAMDADEEMLKKRPAALDTLIAEQAEIVREATTSSLADGRYGELCRQIDRLEDEWYEGTPYEYLAEFNRLRDDKIGENINHWIAEHPGKRVVLVMGADHRTFALENIEARFGNEVKIVPARDP